MHQFSSPILVRQWRENIITVCGQKSLLWSQMHTERRKASKNITEQLISGSAGQYNAMVKIQNKYNDKKQAFRRTKDANSCGDRFLCWWQLKVAKDIILSLSWCQRKGKDSDLTTFEYFKSLYFLNCKKNWFDDLPNPIMWGTKRTKEKGKDVINLYHGPLYLNQMHYDI